MVAGFPQCVELRLKAGVDMLLEQNILHVFPWIRGDRKQFGQEY